MQAKQERYFNTSGPNNVKEHYTLLRPKLVEEGLDLVQKERYFTIWAPRQTGKSTYFLLLKKNLEERGYRVIHLNFENYLDATKHFLVERMVREFKEKANIDFNAQTFAELENEIQQTRNKKVVLIIDEIEGLNPDLFGQFLHTLRNLYHTRTQHCLKSVLLVGVSNIVGVVEDHASPFNIADNINIPFFTNQETAELLGQHEAETGQLFEEKVVRKISEITANQPGLVNGFAEALVKQCKEKALIDYNDYLKIESWFLTAHLNKNISNIINKAKAHRAFVEGLLFRQAKVPFNVYRETIKILYTNGIIDQDEDGYVIFKVPLYKKCLHAAFYPYMNGERERISRDLWVEEFFLPDDTLNIKQLIDNYKKYVQKRGFSYFREKDKEGNYLTIKEAALGYSFETYIIAFIEEAGGKSYLEAHAGLGRTDLIINLRNHEYVIEFKIYSSVNKFKNGKRQLAYYCKKMGLSAGTYLVFMANTVRKPDFVKEDTVHIEGVDISTYLVMYDEMKDF